MIAEVYPLMRLPRTKRAFDYLIPDGQDPQRGSFVRIPYRHEEIWGIVKTVKDKPPRGITLKAILNVETSIQLREEELSFFEHLAYDLAQSPSSVLNAALPIPPKRTSSRPHPPLSWLPLTLPRNEAEHVVRIVHTLQNRGKAFIQTPDLRRAVAVVLGYIQQNPNQKVLILAPTVRDVALVRSHMTGFQPIVITGQESNNERFEAWRAFRESPDGVLLGTRTALMAIDASITSIFLLRASDANHKQWDRNPRYDVRELVWQHQELFASNVFCLDVAPTPSTMYRFSDVERLNWGIYPKVQVINMNQERHTSQMRCAGYTVTQAIESTLAQNQRVLCVYNRKGFEQELRCRDCASRFLCPSCQTPMCSTSHTLACVRCRHKEPIPLRCFNCQSTQLGRFGMGNLDVAQELQEQFPSARIVVLDKEHPELQEADLLIVTTFFYETHFEPFKKSQFGLVIHLDVDAPLYDAKPTAVEALMQDAWQWAWFAFNQRSPILIQTASADLVSHLIEHPFLAAQEELNARERYQLPPLFRWSRIVYKESEKRKAEIAMTQLSDELKHLAGVVVYPLSWNKHGHAVLECGIPRENYASLLAIFTTLPDRYIIDTSLFS